MAELSNLRDDHAATMRRLRSQHDVQIGELHRRVETAIGKKQATIEQLRSRLQHAEKAGSAATKMLRELNCC